VSAARSSGWLATAAVLAAVAATPAAAAVSGSTALDLSGPAAKSLRAAGIRIAPTKPARGGAQRISLPVRGGLAGSGTSVLTHGGGLTLRYDGRTARLSKLRLMLGKRSRLSARLGGREIDVFTVLGGNRAVDPVAGAVELDGLRLRLTRAAAKAIAGRISAQVRPGRFGSLAANASGLSAPGKEVSKTGGQAQKSSGCPLPSSAGLVPEDPLPVATPPPSAVDIAGATIEWHVRESFIRYVNTGEGTSVSGGATADPPVLLPGASAPLTYGFHFPFAEGWHDAGANPSDPGDDRAAIYFGGAVRFLYSGHEIDLTTASPEIELGGDASRAIFTIAEGAEPARREVLVNLDLSRAAAVTASGNSVVYERVPGAIPAGAATSVFGGFYAPGTEFGCFTIAYTTS
jgi:Htaa